MISELATDPLYIVTDKKTQKEYKIYGRNLINLCDLINRIVIKRGSNWEDLEIYDTVKQQWIDSESVRTSC